MLDWARIARAVSFYAALGYEPVDVPWTVSRPVASMRAPVGCKQFKGPYGYLVASAEQGFVQMLLDGWTLRPAVAVSPCFRDEPRLDRLHQPYFMKVELIRPIGLVGAGICLADARTFLANEGIDVSYEKTRIGMDLVLNGVEIGSYGVGRFGPFSWAYGTGLAEPRLERAIQSIGS